MMKFIFVAYRFSLFALHANESDKSSTFHTTHLIDTMQFIQLPNKRISLRTLLISLIRNSLIRLSELIDRYSEPLG